MHDHHHHLLLVGPAGTGHRLLDLGGAVLGNFQARLGRRHDGRASGLAELERRVGVARHEHPLDAHGDGAMQGNNFTDTTKNDLQALVQLAAAGADATRRHVLATAGSLAHYAIAGDPRAGVDTKNQSHKACRTRRCGKPELTLRPLGPLRPPIASKPAMDCTAAPMKPVAWLESPEDLSRVFP
ncbi:hypothetical protein D3C76_1276690 [compost metagenome]